MEQVAQRVEKEGADAWYTLDPADLLGAEAASYEKVTDILDVWFDSGVTHFCVLDQRPNLARAPGDKVMYLEGSDQHRGWFQSSLLTSIAMHGRAPYDEVLTHGFTVDAQGRKMSKSLGNVIAPQKVVDTLRRGHPAPVDRLDRLSQRDGGVRRDPEARVRCLPAHPQHRALPARQSRRLRSDAASACRSASACCSISGPCSRRTTCSRPSSPRMRATIFPRSCSACRTSARTRWARCISTSPRTGSTRCRRSSRGRRSAQSAMYRILEALVRWLAPIVSFTAEEIWQIHAGRARRVGAVRDLVRRSRMRLQGSPSSARSGPICSRSARSPPSSSKSCAANRRDRRLAGGRRSRCISIRSSRRELESVRR